MNKSYQQFRRWLAMCLTMMLIVTGVLPAVPAFAAFGSNWNTGAGIQTPADYVVAPKGDGTTYGTPIKTITKLVHGVELTYKDSSKNGQGVDVLIDNVALPNNQLFANDKIKLPDFQLNSSGAVTKVTVRPKVTVEPTNDTVEIFFQYTPNPAAPGLGMLKFTNTGQGEHQSDPKIVTNRTVSDLKYTYSATTAVDKTQAVEVQVNGVTVRTVTGSGGTLPDIDLSPGLNAVQIFAPNTGERDIIYYEYNSQNSPISITNFSGGTTAYTPVVYGDSTITLIGTYGSGVTGSSLRLKLITNNGTSIQDLANTAPAINGSTFTFSNIGLKPGLNQIAFYEKVGNVTKEHYQFYVQYNNTPLVSDLKVNDTPLNDPNVNTSPTYITVPSLNRLNLNMDGKALNADTVEVKNLRTGDVVKTQVNRTGSFGLSVPSQLGENTLEIRVFNQNKEVGTFVRKLLVTTTSSGSSDQFYKVMLNGVPLLPNQQATISGPATSPVMALHGSALLKFIDIAGEQQFQEFKVTISEGATKTEYKSADGVSYTQIGNPQSGFTEYAVNMPTIPAGRFVDGKTYKVSLSYQYLTKASDNTVTSPSGFINVANYEYEFKYLDSSKPSISQVINLANAQVLSPTAANIIVTSPLELKAVTKNIPNPTTATITYNGQALTSGTDYVITAGTDDFTLTLKKLPQGQGKLVIGYTGAAGSLSAAYTLDIRITPFAQITYVDATGQVRSFEDGYQVKSENDIRNLDGKVYNYVLKGGTTSNIEATLNGTKINIKDSDIDTNKGTFLIAKDELKYKKGNNVLKITLKDDPKTVFTYNVSYNSSKTPSVENVKLEIISNGDTEELTKKAGDASYKTGANFLTNLSFTVNDATHVYIEKNGKRINDFRYKSGDWEQDTTNQEYVKARLEASLNNDLEDLFDETNIDSQSRSRFEGKMSTKKYGDLVEEVQDAVTDAKEQEQKLALFPLTLKKGGTTVYTIVAEDDNGTVIRYDINIDQKYSSWEVLSPVKAKENDPYVIVNSNSAVVKVFAENADKVLFGKTEAKVTNTSNPDFYYDDKQGKTIPETYYVFTSTVPLKKGLNAIKFSVVVGDSTYKDEIKIYNASSTVNGAEYRDVLGKKTTFSVFDKQFELKFPKGTVLLSPDDSRAGQEVKNPNGDIFVDVPLYFGMADRTTGQINIDEDNLEERLVLEANFNYASPLYYVDAGDTEAPGGRDPYFDEGDAEDFKSRWQDNLVPSLRGTLTIKYDPSIVNAANNILTVYYHNGDEWKNIGGVVSTSKKTVTVPFAGFGYYMVMKTRETYDDVIGHDFARDAIETLYAKGIMPAYSGSSFGANRDMTRGEFATMLVKAMDLPINAGPYRDSNERDPLEPTFTDVRPNRDSWDYEYKYIETAARAGIIRGKQPGYFRPDENLTREEAAIMIARALNLKLGTLDASKLALNKMFSDAKDVSYYAAPSVLAVSKAKLMNGEIDNPGEKKSTYSFKPTNNLTRAEMAVITIRVMVQLKKLPKQ
ncbi:S-layer homology domain-containing protein [Brevibacillus formosus]|uniref:S-layer homology domain-containing protein n=1 Tax=Brevibacillus formosus TaxID=54913 RepID=UPI001C66841B|nr:S-layer homology domain-containing protein [Brevibacillus formosus]MBW5468733.1 S-layer homology domain-containing protein [Brevibacillus formosus]